ncbi:MAG: TlpA disulfide reductase family protein [Dysgonamonadaceae bacterium]|nr:TlpA disulfide reductase family protein [Dysgonamonadaceae bacterium]MDD4729009.1 TlpA disulfide reductase family protein [Dysgonamonadaceae bacterium]
MKKILFISIIALIFAACQNKSAYTIHGTIPDETYEGQPVFIEKWTDSVMVKVDSTNIENGKFQFKGNTKHSVLRFITLGENDKKDRSIVMVEPGQVNITYDSIFHITGSAINETYSDFNLKQRDLTTKIRTLSNQYNAAMSNETMTESLDTELKSAYEKIAKESKELNYGFIKNNIDNELGQYLFMTSSGMFDIDQQKEILDMTDDEYKSKKNIKRIVDQIEAMENVAEGKVFVDFTMKNPNGEYVSLSDYVGKDKYVFVDFWASWCGPCRDEMPNVVNAYNKYKNKGFEIVGVSLDKDEDKWIQGIEDLNMTWPQMSDLKLWESEVVGLYAIQSIPHTVLLDKEGKIIAKDLRGEELDAKLAELMN